MNVDEQNEKNAGSVWLLVGLILLVGIVVVVYGIIQTSEQEKATTTKLIDLTTADTLPLVENIPSILEGMSRTEQVIKKLEEENESLNEELNNLKQVVVDIAEDMVILNQTIATR